MKRLVAAVTVLVAALAFGAARAAADGVLFGINDNSGLYEGGTGPFWDTMTGLALTTNTITLRWDEKSVDGLDPTDEADLAPGLAAAEKAGVTIEFDVYPRHAKELSDPAGPARFAAFLAMLAKTYPDVRQYVVMNECNQDLFANPQSRHGRNLSAARCGAFLAAGYDALKAVSPDIFVWGLGLSPRGNAPDKQDHPSTDPIDWLGFLGQWYRASKRTAPLMDGLDLHPYPIPQSLPFQTGYQNPRSFSVANLPRVYAAFYRAFAGTGQATVGLIGRLPVQLNEVGIQTSSAGQARIHRGRNRDRPERRPAASVRHGALPGPVVHEARGLRGVRRRHPLRQPVQARRRDLAGWLAERALLRRLRAQALGRGGAGRDRA